MSSLTHLTQNCRPPSCLLVLVECGVSSSSWCSWWMRGGCASGFQFPSWAVVPFLSTSAVMMVKYTVTCYQSSFNDSVLPLKCMLFNNSVPKYYLWASTLKNFEWLYLIGLKRKINGLGISSCSLIIPLWSVCQRQHHKSFKHIHFYNEAT